MGWRGPARASLAVLCTVIFVPLPGCGSSEGDDLVGGAGNEDQLRGDHGADELDAAPGKHDVASFAVSGFQGSIERGNGVVVDLSTGQAGQDGNDRLKRVEDLIGIAFGDLLSGGGGSDLLISEPCIGQIIEGGPGVDSVSFARLNAGVGVQVQLGGNAVDATHGRFGAGCPVVGSQPSRIDRSVESIEGSASDDALIGDDLSNALLGRGGDDTLRGMGGADFLVGGSAVDSIDGGPGEDRVYARDGTRDRRLICGNDRLQGDVASADPADPSPLGCRLLP